MMNQKTMDALASAIYVSRQSLTGGSVTTDDQRIRASGLYPDWTEGEHAVGDIYNTHSDTVLDSTWEQTWECFAAYDNAVYPDIKPGSTAWYTFNRPLHGKTKETARPFVPVQGSHDMYHTGEYIIWTDGAYYRCTRDTSFGPDFDPGVWAKENAT